VPIFITDNVDEIYVLSWEKFYVANEEDRTVQHLRKGKVLINGSIHDFMMENGFSEEEYFEYVSVLSDAVMDVQELLGVKSIPKLNAALLFRYRFETEKDIIEYVKKYSE
jgi:hypothetical protein